MKKMGKETVMVSVLEVGIENVKERPRRRWTDGMKKDLRFLGLDIQDGISYIHCVIVACGVEALSVGLTREYEAIRYMMK